ncbi:MAG TPA: hypothetical protein VFK05_12490 [Polyangiaceae bacterium]|nr:hypothetical protein [Polyangiaceae bacterium]
MIDTEQLMVSPIGFNLAKATPVQRAGARVRDGRPLGELANDPDVQAAFGGSEALAVLPSERGVKPTEFFNVASARTFKTGLACASAIVDSQSVDLSGLGHGEISRISIVSLKLDVTDVPFRRIVDTMRASPVLKPLLVDETADTLTIRHPSGKLVEVAVVAGGRAASGLVARWLAGVIFDEAPRMTGREDGVVNLSDALSAVRERLLPGAQIQCIGSPWAPSGPVYDVVQQYFGKPTADIVVMRTTGPAGNPAYWTPERLERLREKDEVAWRINALGEFIEPESGLLSPIAIHRNTRETPLQLAPERGARYCASIDPSEGGQAGNGFTLAIVKYEPKKMIHNSDRFRVAFTEDFRGLGLESLWSTIAARCAAYGLHDAWTDQYSASASVALAKRYGLALHVDKTNAGSKLEDFTNFATLLHTDAVELPPDRAVRRDLLAVKRRATQGGMTIVLPRSNDGRHCDFAPAIVAAIKHSKASQHSKAYSTARAAFGSRNGIDPWMLPPKEYR